MPGVARSGRSFLRRQAVAGKAREHRLGRHGHAGRAKAGAVGVAVLGKHRFVCARSG